MMPDQTVAIWILALSFCILLVLRFPVALTLVGSSVLTLWYLEIPLVVVAQQMIQGIQIYSLLAIPFFILTGQILGEGGLANRIVNLANLFVGRIRGGLALVNSVACMFFGNLSGSAVADASAIGSVMIPLMKKKGYAADYSVGVTISSAIQGVVVPPSHNLVLYAIAAGGVSISGLFLAGIVLSHPQASAHPCRRRTV
jgi:tripartite ATP-independent transporter DctM subunit